MQFGTHWQLMEIADNLMVKAADFVFKYSMYFLSWWLNELRSLYFSKQFKMLRLKLNLKNGK